MLSIWSGPKFGEWVKMPSAICFNLDQPKMLSSGNGLNHSIFFPVNERHHHLRYSQFFVCKCFQFGLVQNFVVWEWVKMPSAICFNLDQSKMLSSGNGLNHSIFFPINERHHHLRYSQFFVCKCFQFAPVWELLSCLVES